MNSFYNNALDDITDILQASFADSTVGKELAKFHKGKQSRFTDCTKKELVRRLREARKQYLENQEEK